jgi:hypothetical protein
MPFSNYVAYFDESGDHGLARIDPSFPVFVLCACVFRIADYLGRDLPAFGKIKFDHFGHDAVIFHSRDIRKQVGAFQILSNASTRTNFNADLAAYYANSSCTLIAAAIEKNRLSKQYKYPNDPYQMSLLFCLERLYGFLVDRNEQNGTLTCVFEKRGPKEDAALAAEFVRICGGQNYWGPLPFQAVFASKQTNMAGLQIADLAAYPIAKYAMNPTATNPAYASVQPRLRRSNGGKVIGYGLKMFP